MDNQEDIENIPVFQNVNITSYALMSNPLLNKGTAFTLEERKEFNLFGLLPPHQSSLQEQAKRVYAAFQSKHSDIEKYIYLRSLQDRNETLFYRLLYEHIVEVMPIVYTPVVGQGCERFSHIYRQPRGVFIAYPYKNDIELMLAHPQFDSVRVIVVSDGERILGLGDQGAGGMGIPIGKLSLYTACAGIHPALTLPILLDTGTDNEERLEDPLYLGWRHRRIRGKEYDDFIEAFVQAVKKRFPNVLLQWEDFAQHTANPILNRYRDQVCSFNDDIQGTAAVTVGTLLAAVNVTNVPLAEQRVVIVGAGSAGVGISNLLVQAMMEEGISEEEAISKFFLIDREGLLVEGLTNPQLFQQHFVKSRSIFKDWGRECSPILLEEMIQLVHPTILIGVSGQFGLFTEEIVREMAAHVQHPIIFSLSNPPSCSEAVPENLMKWTDGRVILGMGSPFPAISKNGKQFRIDQTNNSYIFPGIGLGVIAVKAKFISDRMFMAAAKALANCSPTQHDPEDNLLPPLTDIRRVSYEVAFAVAKEAFSSGLAEECSDDDLKKRIQEMMWKPSYRIYTRVK